MLHVPPIQGPLRTGGVADGALRGAAGTALAAPARIDAPTPSAPAVSSAQVPALRASASALREPGLHQRLGALQQAQAYAEPLGRALQRMKQGLSQALARPSAPDPAGLQAQAEALDRLWRARAGNAGGLLDARLQLAAEGSAARQRFGIRGLNLDGLGAGGRETLRLIVPGQVRPLSVALEGDGPQPALQRLQRVLAPAGVQIHTDAGDLQFSVEEAVWPALRDGLGVLGEGKRFPSGQPVRAMLDAADEALTPAAWRLDGVEGQRRALAQVSEAQARLGRAQRALGQRLDSAARLDEPAQSGTGDAAALQGFAAEFARAPGAAPLDYGRLRALAPALQGLHRAQVQQLLGG